MENTTIQVKVGEIGQRTVEYTLADGASVRDLVTAAGLETSGHVIRVNGEPVQLNDQLEDGDLVTRTPNLKAG